MNPPTLFGLGGSLARRKRVCGCYGASVSEPESPGGSVGSGDGAGSDGGGSDGDGAGGVVGSGDGAGDGGGGGVVGDGAGVGVVGAGAGGVVGSGLDGGGVVGAGLVGAGFVGAGADGDGFVDGEGFAGVDAEGFAGVAGFFPPPCGINAPAGTVNRAVDFLPVRYGAGSVYEPFTITSKWRWQPVDRPVDPILPIT